MVHTVINHTIKGRLTRNMEVSKTLENLLSHQCRKAPSDIFTVLKKKKMRIQHVRKKSDFFNFIDKIFRNIKNTQMYMVFQRIIRTLFRPYAVCFSFDFLSSAILETLPNFKCFLERKAVFDKSKLKTESAQKCLKRSEIFKNCLKEVPQRSGLFLEHNAYMLHMF